MKRLGLTTLLVLIFSAAVGAQTLSPPIKEFTVKPGKVIRGSFTLQNDGVTPLPVTLESTDLSLDAKGPHNNALLPTEHVTLSQTSTRLGPKETAQIDYKITCDALPCNVEILSFMSMGKTNSGLQVRLVLPHLVYIGTSKTPRQDAITAAGLSVSN